MKKFFEEFKAFALRGSVIDLTIGVLIGGAFSALVAAFSEDIVNPLIGLLGGANVNEFGWVVTIGGASLLIGKFISAVINFVINAFVIFIIVKSINKVSSLGKKEEPAAPAEPTTKVCPYCQSEISIKATKCPHCTSDLAE